MTAEPIRVSPPRMGRAVFHIEGVEVLMTAKFSSRIKEGLIKEREQEGTKPAKRKKQHEPTDYQARGMEAAYLSSEDWYGVHAAAFRNAAISACRLINFKMTIAKLSVFVEADGYDRYEGTPLVRIYGDDPKVCIMPVRNADGSMDLRARPIWTPGWRAVLRMRWDLDQFTVNDIANLLRRVGDQVGIGEGRPDSRKSAGLGYGVFELKGVEVRQ